MKTFLTTFLILISSLTLSAQATKTVRQNFNLNEGMSLTTELYGDVTFYKWDYSYVKVELDIKTNNFTKYALDQLGDAGRYKLESRNDGDHLHIFNIPTQYRIKVSGIDLNESFTYRIYVPASFNDDNLHILFAPSKIYSPTQNQKPIN